MIYVWANPQHQGVLRLTPGQPPMYLDSGPEHEAALVAGPQPYPGIVQAAPEPADPDAIRATRDGLLVASDWTQLPDAPVDSAAWAAYRQALRDLTDQPGFPDTLSWPVPPGAA
jgi:hypothetical protein